MNNLTKNDTLTGSLADSDELNPLRIDSYYHDYQLADLVVGETVIIDLSSANFDTYLQLVDADTGELITDDDDGGDNANSRLSFTPQANTNYLVRVTSYDSQVTGDFTLITEVFDLDIDLSVTDVNAPNAGQIGDIVEASWTVTNQGTEATNSNYWSDRIYVSDDEQWSEDDTLATGIWTDDEGFVPVAGGESYTTTNSFALPNTEPGDRFLLFITDQRNHQAEANENNNTVALPISLTAPDVDLVINETNIPTDLIIGETVEASWTVTNQGTDETSFSDELYDAIYISDDEILDDSDTYADDYWSAEFMPLGEGDSYPSFMTLGK